MRELRIAALAVAALAASCAGARQHPVHQEDRVDRLVQPVLDGGWTGSMVVGLIGPDGTEIHGYGRIRPGGPAPDGDTLYEIGSVTKTFTGLLLSLAVEAGEVSLDEPVQELVPVGAAVVPVRNGKAITLEHLTTHTSGLARDPDDLSGWENPFAGYRTERLYGFLGRTVLQSDPGERWSYSNVGVGLLGHALALRAKEDYADLLRERVLAPLGMRDTALALSPEQARRFAQPHDGELRPVSAWDLGILAGAGGLRSTARDLLRYVGAQAGLTASPLGPAMARTQVPWFPVDAHDAMGLGWIVSEKRFVCHQGGTRGTEAFVGFDRVTRKGVVVLVDTVTGFEVAKKVGVALLRMMAGGEPGALELPPAVALPRSTLARYAGTFAFTDPGTGRELSASVALTGDSLEATLPGGGRLRLYATSETEFYVRTGDQLRGTFQPGPGESYDTIVVRQPGRPAIIATRVR